MELHLLIFGLCLLAYGTAGNSDLKSSLTFVIDDTDTMDDDIKEIAKAIDAIVDTVANSSTSPIEEFILVTYGDEVKLVTKTKDKAVLGKELKYINTGGGGECAEKALKGIELALNESQDGSLIYVFSDASAEDHKEYEKIVALSQKKGVQIVFILTGVCEEGKTSDDYLVYQKIAEGTNGQVFHLKKLEIGEIFKYIQSTVESRKNILASKTLPAESGNTLDVTVDGDTKELVISISGENPSVTVTSNGAEVPIINITRLQELAVVKIAVKPSVYKVAVHSESETHVVVSASTAVHFQHGFSTITPSAITDTVRRPVPSFGDQNVDPDLINPGIEIQSYLSVQLGPGGSNVKLHSVQILNMNDSLYIEEPLTLVNKDEHFYTTNPITVPDDMFKIAIQGYDRKKAVKVTRYSLTPVKKQSKPDTLITKTPEVAIDGAPTIKAEFYKPLQLKCKVSGLPKPDVIWTSSDNTSSSDKFLIEQLSIVEIPYDYVLVLNIHKVTKNATYTCDAVNSEGNNTALTVAVETEETKFIEVTVEDTTIEYEKEGVITCDVQAYPQAKIFWYKERSALKSDENLEISTDGSTITINSMEPKYAGKYYCVAKNSVSKITKPLKVNISGVGPPTIDKTIYEIKTTAHTEDLLFITCTVVATPVANISWTFKNDTSFIVLNDTIDTLVLYDAASTDAGTYTCKAENSFGVDYHGINLIVQSPPTISKNLSASVTAIAGHMAILNCSAEGSPAPNITWTRNGENITTIRHSFYSNGSLGFSAKDSDEGTYTCEANNEHGNDTYSIQLEIIIPVSIEAPKKSVIELKEGTPLLLECIADGTPQPNTTWIFHKTGSKGFVEVTHNHGRGNLAFPRIQHVQSGEYTCVATNAGGSKNITYIVSVKAPPSILYTQKTFKAVVDDRYLRVPCDAIGNPKPEIVWSTNNSLIASDTEWYLIGDDGSLIIKDIAKEDAGIYNCTATNKYGTVYEYFTVEVDKYPTEHFLSILIEEGKSVTIPCSVPHSNKTDRVRWFKDEHSIPIPVLDHVTEAHAGNYTCRVSSVDRMAQSGTTSLAVGSMPRFKSEAKNITFAYYETAVMDCSTTGIPEPTMTWLHNGEAISFTGSKYELFMDGENKKGRYTCAAINWHGYAEQDFYVISEW